jgi:hypothetical protein
MKKAVLLLYSFLQINFLFAKDSVAYSREYEFKEGLFLTVEHFKKNDPILKSSIISSYPKSQVDFMKQITEQKYITYKAADGSEQKIETMSFWGYCQNRSLYINFNNEFYRINQIGTLCHFTAVVSTPMSYNDPMNTYGINSNDEMRQFLFDTRTNEAIDFNSKNMEILLKDDPELLAEFSKLKKRKKVDSIFIFFRRYNEKHPLYLPLN